jgi:hypothetical protein
MFIVQAAVLFVLTFTAPFKTAGLITIIFRKRAGWPRRFLSENRLPPEEAEINT